MPRAAAARAAARPAGPAPITARSVIVTGPPLGADLVPRPDRDQASPLIRTAVDGDEAVEADADAAEDAARAALSARGAPGGDACRPQRGRDRLPGQRLDRAAVEGDGERRAG